jgi:exonuclease SbcC
MFLQLKLKCFRQHVNKTVTYEEGLNVIRGANESGKSTLEEAIQYALFGSDALDQALADVVTWGHKETELGVEFLMRINDRMFKYTRSKSGAQVEYDGGIITGQREVSKFTREILGVDKDLARHLLFANQTDIRGAIDAKPGAVAELIETMANFDLFDTLVNRMNEELPMGSTKVLDGQLLEAKAKVSAMVLVEPDTSDLDGQIVTLNAARDHAQHVINEKRNTLSSVRSEWQSAENMARVYTGLKTNFDKVIESRQLKEVELGHNKTLAATPSVKSKIEEIEKQIADVDRTKVLMDRALKVEELMEQYPDVFWDEPFEKYVSEVTRLERLLEATNDAKVDQFRVLQGAQEALKLKQSSLIHDMTCPTCKRAFDNQSDLIAQNEQTQSEINTLQTRIDTVIKPEIDRISAEIEDLKGELDVMRNLQVVARPYEALASAEFVEADLNFYPPKLKWVGQVDFKHVAGKNLQAQLDELRASQRSIDQAALKVPMLEQGITEDTEQLERLQQQMSECSALSPDDINKLKDNYNKLSNELAAAESDLVGYGTQMEAIQNQIRDARYAYEQSIAQKDALQATVSKLEADIEEMEFHNQLLVKIRKARPTIADQLWGMVLGSVSNMFSQMRGETSVVTTDSDGFKVNGVPAESFSGSAKDLLGLALRMSLMKTFLPSISILVLDEPGAAMDDNRVSNMLGYIAAANFEQVILITHEEISETFANHVINL